MNIDFYTPIIDDKLRASHKEELAKIYNCYIWETSDKCVIPITEMKTSHLINGFYRITYIKLTKDFDNEEFLYYYDILIILQTELSNRNIIKFIPEWITIKHNNINKYNYIEDLDEFFWK